MNKMHITDLFNDVCIIGKHKFKLIDGHRRTLKENIKCTRTTFLSTDLTNPNEVRSKI